ncbi:MAG: 3-hydroxyacyl-CoA dehydrogenase NAD-binding domain-containing protein [Acidobacteriota bacterium]
MAQERSTPLTIAIIGAGPLGRWLALHAARAGFRVFLEDVLPSNLHHAREYIRQRLSGDALSRDPGAAVTFVSTIEDAVRPADLAIDCVPDELESKLEILWLLDRMAPPQTIFATPTAQLSIADLASCTYRPEKCIAIAARPQALAELEAQQGAAIPLRAGPATSAETVDLVERFWRALGFPTNRLAIRD